MISAGKSTDLSVHVLLFRFSHSAHHLFLLGFLHYMYSPSPIISISILGLRSQNAYIKAKAEVSPKHMLI